MACREMVMSVGSCAGGQHNPYFELLSNRRYDHRLNLECVLFPS